MNIKTLIESDVLDREKIRRIVVDHAYFTYKRHIDRPTSRDMTRMVLSEVNNLTDAVRSRISIEVENHIRNE